MSRFTFGALLLASCCAAAIPASAQPASDPLAEGFISPPATARPRVWWHWMNGNITRDGIEKDLSWMQRIGLGGLQNFDVALNTPVIVPERLAYMTPKWKETFRYAVETAVGKGLEFGIAGSPGWSESGGPWVTPPDAMKKLVWSEAEVVGGRRVTAMLPALPATTGHFQDQGIEIRPGMPSGPSTPTFSASALVLAYPIATQAATLPAATYAIEGVQGATASLGDGKFGAGVDVPRGTVEKPAAIAVTYPAPVTVRSATVALGGGRGGQKIVVQVSDGGTWRTIAEVSSNSPAPTTFAFAPVTGAAFRFLLSPEAGVDALALLGYAPGVDTSARNRPTAPTFQLTEASFSPEARIDKFELKAGFAIADDYYALPDVADAASGIDPRRVVNVTDRVGPDGRIDWVAPAGRWRIVRLGYSLTGTTNHPATAEATGLEVDKFDAQAVRRYAENYLKTYVSALGPDLVGAKGLRAMVVDSNETGASNWTASIVDDFKRLRGYDPTPWLPALTGAIVGSRTQSDAFLYDYRRTLADLLSTAHYGEIAKVAHEHGITLYGEALEIDRPILGDDLAMRRYADVPMAAMWTYQPGFKPRLTFLADMKGASSVSHLYGQNLVAAESMTSGMAPWAFAPADLKKVIDLEFAYGVNRPVIHSSVHQPLDDKQPGLALSVFGQYFNRHDTWAEMARPWIDYIARSAFLLQQGRNVADVAYFIGEERPVTELFTHQADDAAPRRNAFDYVNTDALVNQLKVDNGDLVAASGARYRAIYLGGSSKRMTVAVLRRLDALAAEGATIIGERPVSSPSLADEKADFEALAGKLWAGGHETRVGQGRVVATSDLQSGLDAAGIAPDLAYSKAQPDSLLDFVHRKVADGEIYYLYNVQERPETFDLAFNVAGKLPELWHAETGTSSPLSYRIEGGTTHITMPLPSSGSAFVVFRKPATAPALTLPAERRSVALAVDGPWDVSFDGLAAPKAMRMDKLASLSESSDPAIRYFSGRTTYTRTITLSKHQAAADTELDLGAIGSIAEVRVNGRSAGYAWHAPNRVSLKGYLRPGANRVEIKVANLWVNRLIGDAQPGATKVTYITGPSYRADAPLRPSGLIGPVSLVQKQ